MNITHKLLIILNSIYNIDVSTKLDAVMFPLPILLPNFVVFSIFQTKNCIVEYSF